MLKQGPIVIVATMLMLLTAAPAHADEPKPCEQACSATPDEDSDAGWIIIGIGGSVAAANIAAGATMMGSNSSSEQRLGVASLVGGATGLAVSLIVGLIVM